MGEVTAEGGEIVPVNVPPLVERDEDVLTGNNTVDLKAAIGIGLVAAKFGDAGGIVNGAGDEHDHSSLGGLALEGGDASDRGAAGGDVQGDGGVTSRNSNQSATEFFASKSDAGEEEVGGGLVDEITARRKLDDTRCRKAALGRSHGLAVLQASAASCCAG